MGTKKRVLEGVVVSDKMQKTIVVECVRMATHSLYKKRVKVRKKYKAHDEKSEAKIGDRVRIIESRPYSKEKKWRLLEVVR